MNNTCLMYHCPALMQYDNRYQPGNPDDNLVLDCKGTEEVT